MSGSPLVLIHAIGLDGDAWQFCEGLDAALSVTLPGHGGVPMLAEVTLPAVADHLAGTIAVGSTVVGCSLGGAIAQHLALRHPDRVASLVLVCTKPVMDRGEMLRRAEATLQVGAAAQVESTLARWFTPASLAAPAHPGVGYARATLVADRPTTISRYWQAMAEHDLRHALQEVTQPTTVVVGADDATATVADGEAFARLLPTARLDVRVGPHMLPLERPEQVSEAIHRHLEWVEQRGR